VAVLKAESDSAFIKEKTAKGLLLKFISEMVFGAQQRLYKIGCFVETKRRAAGDGDGVRSKEDFEVNCITCAKAGEASKSKMN